MLSPPLAAHRAGFSAWCSPPTATTPASRRKAIPPPRPCSCQNPDDVGAGGTPSSMPANPCDAKTSRAWPAPTFKESGNLSLLGGLNLLATRPAIGPGKGAEIVEAYAVLTHHLMRERPAELADIEGLLDHEMVDRVAAAEVEAERLQRPQPPGVEHLGLLDHVARLDVAVVVHVRADKVQTE